MCVMWGEGRQGCLHGLLPWCAFTHGARCMVQAGELAADASFRAGDVGAGLAATFLRMDEMLADPANKQVQAGRQGRGGEGKGRGDAFIFPDASSSAADARLGACLCTACTHLCTCMHAPKRPKRPKRPAPHACT